MSSIRKTNNYNKGPFITTILLFFVFNIDTSNALKCFKCTVVADTRIVNNEQRVVIPACSKFDESDQFIVECEHSTMCLKTISTIHLQNGNKQETVTRGCAQQKETTQVFRNRQWEQEHSVLEVYEEGCKVHGENYLSASTNTQCYCRGKLCNFAPQQLPVYTLLTVSFIISFWLSA